MEYNLNLTENEVNQILLTLSKQPYEQVFMLIDKVRGQAVEQDNIGTHANKPYNNNENTGLGEKMLAE